MFEDEIIFCTNFLTKVDKLNNEIINTGILYNEEKLEDIIKNIAVAIKSLQVVSKKLADVSNIAVNIHNRKKDKKLYNIIDPYPGDYDSFILRTLYNKSCVNITKNIDLNVINVESINDIPVSNLYYIKNLEQFAINIDGVILRGNIGNITEKESNGSFICDYGKNCKNAECTFYHDPADKKVSKFQRRNFTVGSWIYSPNQKKKNGFCRHVGNYSSLDMDIANLKKMQYNNEIQNREHQTIHDILIYMCLVKKGMVGKYNWE